jgi:trk system potassium uptake protein TrkH
MSALTTTGGTVIAGLDHQPRGLLLWRGLLQWLGGVGIVLLAIILLPVLNIGGMKLLRTADFNTLVKIMPRARQIALSIGSVYGLLTLACVLGYAWTGMSGFDAIVHAMTTLSSGGMANYDVSFAGFGPGSQYVSTVFMLAAAFSFVRFVQLAQGDPSALFGDRQIRVFLAIYAGFVLAHLVGRLQAGAPLSEATVREVLFNVASVISSTGFASTDYGLWGGLSDSLMFCIMMIGGCSGSTAGGVKVFRYQLLAGAVAQELRRLHTPNVVEVTRYYGRRVSPDLLDSVIAFFLFYFLTLGVLALLLVLSGTSFITATSGAATALANVGPGLGPEIGPAGNFAGLGEASKWLLSAGMLVGRLEILAVFVLFVPAFWRV